MTSSSPIPHITDETRAYTMFAAGYGWSDIAVTVLKRDSEEARAKVRKLVEDGRAKALGAH